MLIGPAMDCSNPIWWPWLGQFPGSAWIALSLVLAFACTYVLLVILYRLIHLQVADRRYYFREPKNFRNAIKNSKVGDDSRVKGLLDKRAFMALEKYLNEKEGKSPKEMSVLQTTVTELYGMGKVMVETRLDVTFGDFMFALGSPFPLKTLGQARLLAAVLLPAVSLMPYACLYPLSSGQDKPPQPKWTKYYKRSQLIAVFFRSAGTCPMTLQEKLLSRTRPHPRMLKN